MADAADAGPREAHGDDDSPHFVRLPSRPRWTSQPAVRALRRLRRPVWFQQIAGRTAAGARDHRRGVVRPAVLLVRPVVRATSDRQEANGRRAALSGRECRAGGPPSRVRRGGLATRPAVWSPFRS